MGGRGHPGKDGEGECVCVCVCVSVWVYGGEIRTMLQAEEPACEEDQRQKVRCEGSY